MKKGSYLKDMDIEDICNNVTPSEFIIQLLRYQVNKDREKLARISDQSGVEFEKICTLCDFLLSEIDYEELLRLQYRAYPQDRQEIKVPRHGRRARRSVRADKRCVRWTDMYGDAGYGAE